MKHNALYCRESIDRNGRAENIADQEGWGREYAAGKWPGQPVVVYADNDISAAKDAHRPGYEALRAAVAHGEVAHLWCVEQSRLERREIEWFILAAELHAAGIEELHTNRDGLVRVRDELAGIKAVLNAAEVRKLTARINDRLDSLAGQGRPPGSVPFGYRHALSEDGTKTYAVVPEQAEAIRWAADRVLAGWSLSHVAEKLRDRGVVGAHRVKVRDADGNAVTDGGKPVTRPGKITAGSVRSWLTKPTVAGHRVHRGVDKGPGSGNWQPIIDEATWQACRAKLGAARTVKRADGGSYPVPGQQALPGRKYLLTGGLAVCGVCQAPLVGTIKQMHGRDDTRPYLVCHKKQRRPDGTPAGSCVGIMLAETETHVLARLFAELDKPQFLARLAADQDAGRRNEITAKLDGIQAQRRELAALWSARDLTSAEWKAARDGLDEQETGLRGDLAAIPPAVANVDVAAAKRAWPVLDLDERREFIRLFVARVTIHRAKPGLKRFDERRVSVEWRKR